MRWQNVALLVVVVVVRKSLLVRARWRLAHLRRLVGLVLLTGRKRSGTSQGWPVLLKGVSALVLHVLRRVRSIVVVSGRSLLFIVGGNREWARNVGSLWWWLNRFGAVHGAGCHSYRAVSRAQMSVILLAVIEL